jgi:hypothetical protein
MGQKSNLAAGRFAAALEAEDDLAASKLLADDCLRLEDDNLFLPHLFHDKRRG